MTDGGGKSAADLFAESFHQWQAKIDGRRAITG
jgi:hypothetical protein